MLLSLEYKLESKFNTGSALFSHHSLLLSKSRTIDLVLFYFLFIFLYFLLFFIVDHKTKKTKCDTVTGHITQSHKSHAHMI